VGAEYGQVDQEAKVRMVKPIDRRQALAAVAMSGFAGSPVVGRSRHCNKTVLYEHTFLKAKPERRDALLRYIVANWFTMDRAGVKQGIFTSYQLLEEIDEIKDWDAVMVVGYPQAQGYEEPKTTAAFKAIRAAHTEQLIDGFSLKDLGDIVRHHRLRVRGG
jgi:hypothetical protein